MSLIKCKATSCAHNADCKCVGGKIAVKCCGDECSPACCASYTTARKKDATVLKMEAGIIDGISAANTSIMCQASACRHNKDNRCTSVSISITEPKRMEDGKCFCASFEPET